MQKKIKNTKRVYTLRQYVILFVISVNYSLKIDCFPNLELVI